MSFPTPTFLFHSSPNLVCSGGGRGRIELIYLKKKILDRPSILNWSSPLCCRDPSGGKGGSWRPQPSTLPKVCSHPCEAPTLPQTRTETRLPDLKLSWAPLDGIPVSDFFPPNFTNAV